MILIAFTINPNNPWESIVSNISLQTYYHTFKYKAFVFSPKQYFLIFRDEIKS
jgi:hypothetical protein